MKKTAIALTVLSMFGMTSAVHAATAGGSGLINFTGVVNNDACSISGAAGNDKVISVDMGNVAIKDMGTAANPQSGAISQRNFQLSVNCNLGTKVTLRFSPSTGGPGVVAGSRVLALTPGIDTARGVGIALLNSEGNLIDLSSPATAKIEGTLLAGAPGDGEGAAAVGGDTTLRFAAAYVTTGGATAPGVGNSTLPFILEYE
ncbi:fimbrial protein [Pseudomonas frederiksbergensis]|uniref:fimbrial protein n=1 Tax=Pseudomonas frederiksbergensis TaxID=104087 RepID=UPI003D064C56